MKLSSKSRTLWIEWKQDTKFPTEKHKNIKDVEAAVAIVGTRNASNIVNAIYYSITGPVYIIRKGVIQLRSKKRELVTPTGKKY